MDQNNETVDILLATYNTDINYLKMQIESILNQTYKNIHILISDDCSSKEEVKDILKKYEKQDSRVTVYLQEKNIGYLKNFEFLLTKSKSEYISLSDHDDIWYENKIEKSIQVLKEKNVDLVYCDCKQIDENGQILNESYIQYKNIPIINGKNSILAFSRHIAIGCSTMFTKKIKNQMLPFTNSVMAHDWINVYLSSKQNGIACIKETLFEYRLHQNNEFGGRSLKQNLSKWKEKYGTTYKAYKKYRNERVIKTAYLDGATMCIQYRDKLNLEKDINEEKVIDYYNKLINTKIINFRIDKYEKYLAFKGIGKRRIKEELVFHLPLISYLAYCLN